MRKKHVSWIVLVLILVFALSLRLWHLSFSNIWVDEYISSLAVEKILEKGIPVLDSGFVYSRALVFHYLGSFFALFTNSILALRFVSVLSGLFTVVLAFFIGREFDKGRANKELNDKVSKVDKLNYDNKSSWFSHNITGLVSSLFVSVLFLEVWFSRQARFYQMFQLFFFLTLFLIYKSKDNKKYAWLSGISFLVLVDTHIAGLIIAPLFAYVFLANKKDFKLLIIPFIVCLYYGLSVFNIPLSSSSDLASRYLEQYSSSLFYRLRAFALISLLGIPLAYLKNKRLTLMIIIPSIVLFLSLILLKVYALRYAYFIVFLSAVLISLVFSFIYSHSKTLFIIVLLFALLYPSNLFFTQGYLTTIKPEAINIETFSEPVLDYNFNQTTKEFIENNKIVALFTPSVSVLFKSPDYFIPFSLSGISEDISKERDVYTNAEAFDFENPQISSFVFIEDAFGYSKLSDEQITNIEKTKQNCSQVEQTRSVKVFSCLF